VKRFLYLFRTSKFAAETSAIQLIQMYIHAVPRTGTVKNGGVSI